MAQAHARLQSWAVFDEISGAQNRSQVRKTEKTHV